MAISEPAQQVHEELFPGHVSTLIATDPELIEYFDNFAFDEVLRYGNLERQDPAHGAARIDDRVPGASGVPGHAGRGLDRRRHSG